jgi:osmotically-inducible protein OsmY
MERGEDRFILQRVTQQLCTRGIRHSCNVTATTRNGAVTLTGTIQNEYSRRNAMHAATVVTGVLRVNDCLQSQPVVKRT